MNLRIISYITAKVLLIFIAFLALPFILSLCFHELDATFGIVVTMVILGILGVLFGLKKPANMRFTSKEGIMTTALIWVAMAFFGSLPFFLSGAIPHLTDAIFETASGFTTTGSSILTDVEALPKSLLFWRNFTNFIGGMGVLVFAFAIIPGNASEGYHLLKSEMPGPTFGKLVSRLRQTAIILYGIYTAFTVILIFILMFAGMNWFDATLQAFATAGTGGFSNYGDSIAHFHSPLIEYIIAFGMIIFGINFNFYFLAFRTNIKNLFKSEEVRWYLGIIAVATTIFMTYLISTGENIGESLRTGLFTTSTIITTTGFGTVDFTTWALFPQFIILLLMFMGGCAGSTAGGLKVSRVIAVCKMANEYLKRVFHPRRVTTVRREGKPMDENDRYDILGYFAIYILLFVTLLGIICLDKYDFTTSFSAVAATFNNVGPGLGVVGPTGNYAEFSNLSKWALTLSMIAGRLEILPVLLLLSPRSWLSK